MILGNLVLSVAAAPVALASGYLLLLALLSRRRPPAPDAPPRLRFDLVVPAHDEEASIAATVQSLATADWPAALRRVLVVADNCSDATADRAAAAGATVLVRDDPRRGKGWALAHAFERSLADGFADAVVVVDADTVVSPRLLRAFAARLDAGALAVQAHYGVRNPGASWRTRLATIAFALFHGVRSLARERLGLSAGLRGNGMCFAARVLREVPYAAFSIVEDVEYGLRLGLAGHRVHYAADAAVLGEMPATAAASRSQRHRWEGGRAALLRAHARPLLRAAVGARDRVALDLLVDLVVPPLAALGTAAAAGTALAVAASVSAGAVLASAWLFGTSLAALVVYLARGWWLSGTGVAGLGALLRAPAYAAWKLALALDARGAPETWVRTAREPPAGPRDARAP